MNNKQILPAEVTDGQIESEFQRCGGKWNGNQWVIEDADLHPFARAILALRPVQVPMTDEEIEKINCVTLHQTDWDSFAVYEPSVRSFARAIEAHHGIKAHD